MTKKQKGRQDYDATPEKFIEIWQTSNSADEVAERLGMPKPIVHARASNYRSSGVKLKKMPRKSKRGLDVERLNELIAKLGDGEEVGNKRKKPNIDSPSAQAVVEQVIQAAHRK